MVTFTFLETLDLAVSLVHCIKCEWSVQHAFTSIPLLRRFVTRLHPRRQFVPYPTLLMVEIDSTLSRL